MSSVCGTLNSLGARLLVFLLEEGGGGLCTISARMLVRLLPCCSDCCCSEGFLSLIFSDGMGCCLVGAALSFSTRGRDVTWRLENVSMSFSCILMVSTPCACWSSTLNFSLGTDTLQLRERSLLTRELLDL